MRYGSCATPKGRTYSPLAKQAVVSPSGPCALRGGCGSLSRLRAALRRLPSETLACGRVCGSLMDNAAFLRNCHHCPRRRLAILLHSQNMRVAFCHLLRRLPAKTCHYARYALRVWQLYRSYGDGVSPPPFSFCEKETKTRTKGR